MKDFKAILVGLGNPDREYKETYHNAGALLAEFLADGAAWRKPGQRPFKYCFLGDIVLIRPLTYMNESGRAVSAALNYFKSGQEKLVVAQDESDLPIGEFKISANRGAAGHKGIASIAKETGTKNFMRIRIGIRSGRGKAGSFVLKKISPGDNESLQLVFGEILKLITKDQFPFSEFKRAL